MAPGKANAVLRSAKKPNLHLSRSKMIFRFFVGCIVALSMDIHSTAECAESTVKGAPNIVILLADDLGWADVGFHSDRVATPHIDRLVQQGIELDRFYVAPMCSPTRAGLLTGRYPIRFGLARAVIPPYRDFGLPPSEVTLAERLAEVGYVQRGVFGKWHLGHLRAQWHPLAQGFTHFEGHYNGAIDYFSHVREGQPDWHVNYKPANKLGYSTDLIAAAASEFILRSAAQPQPYFCYVPFNAPHSPFQAKPEDLSQYDANAASEQVVDVRVKLRAMIGSLDQGVGQILNAIEQSGEAENTQVWFMSDNGGVRQVKDNNLPLRGNKLTAFEGGIRVPACVRWPAAWPGGRKVDRLLGYIDVLPTVLESIEPGRFGSDRLGFDTVVVDGVSAHGLFTGAVSDMPNRDWYTYHGQGGPRTEKIAITTNRWKLVVEGPALRSATLNDQHTVSLFSMPNDLRERENLSQRRPQVVQQLLEKLLAHRALQPRNGVPPYSSGKEGFVPPDQWRITPPGVSED